MIRRIEHSVNLDDEFYLNPVRDLKVSFIEFNNEYACVLFSNGIGFNVLCGAD